MNAPVAYLLETAVDAVRAAGAYVSSQPTRRKDAQAVLSHDIKLLLDMECQRIIEGRIRARFPEHACVGEESASHVIGTGPTWVIDPIDGTVNFAHGLPYWCHSVSVRHAGDVVAAAVYAPELDYLYTASSESPAMCNGTIIHPSQETDLSRSIVLSGITKHMDRHPGVFELFKELCLRTQKVRLMGSAALDVCAVAAGQADGYVETGIYVWDVDAAGYIARRAGARVEILEKLSPVRFRYLCANPELFMTLRSLLMRYPPPPSLWGED